MEYVCTIMDKVSKLHRVATAHWNVVDGHYHVLFVL